MTDCIVDDCDAASRRNGLCQKHYARLKRTGTTDKKKSTKPRCSVDECSRVSERGGMCRTHRYGEYAHLFIKSEVCTDPSGCENGVHAKELCKRHYQAKKRSASDAAKKQPVECVENGCNNVVSAKKRCHNHYKTWLFRQKKAESARLLVFSSKLHQLVIEANVRSARNKRLLARGITPCDLYTL